MYSKDPILGVKIHELLQMRGVENPVFFDKIKNCTHEVLKNKLHELIELLGLDLSNSSISKTPDRVSKFFLDELFYGLDYNKFPKATANINDYNYQNPVFSKSINFVSTCEHHFANISGKAHVAYIPKNKIIGLSKINRIVDFFAKRPQVQERATRQIFYTLQYVLETDDVAVAINAKHNCLAIRGIKHEGTDNLTFEFGGKFLSDQNLHNNFYKIISNEPF